MLTLAISERLLEVPQLAGCAATCFLWSRPVITAVEGTPFRDLLADCYPNAGNCPLYLDYGNIPIGCWDTSNVKDMYRAFKKDGSETGFNKAINCWNTARVTDMRGMFYQASNFDQSLNNWNVESVNGMHGMFDKASDFNQPLNNWNVTRVTSMGELSFGYYGSGGYGMFREATNFNQPLDGWDVSSVKVMYRMFYQATKFNQCLSTWADKTPPDVNVDDIFESSGCPYNANPNQLVGPWCQGNNEQCYAPPTIADDCTLCTSFTLITDNGSYFQALVANCIGGSCPDNVPIGCWNTSAVTDMEKAFKSKTSFNDSINCWNVASVPCTIGSTITRQKNLH